MSSRKNPRLALNGQNGKKPNDQIIPKSGSGHLDSDDRWVELLDDLERLLQGIRRASGLTPDDSDEIRSEVVVRLLSMLASENVLIRVSFEAWLRGLIRSEIRQHLGNQNTQPKLVLVDNSYLSQLATLANDANDEQPAKSTTRQAELQHLLQAIETIRQKVGKPNWDLFIDIAVNGTPIKIAAGRHGKSYFAAHKTFKRIEAMLHKEASKSKTR